MSEDIASRMAQAVSILDGYKAGEIPLDEAAKEILTLRGGIATKTTITLRGFSVGHSALKQRVIRRPDGLPTKDDALVELIADDMWRMYYEDEWVNLSDELTAECFRQIEEDVSHHVICYGDGRHVLSPVEYLALKFYEQANVKGFRGLPLEYLASRFDERENNGDKERFRGLPVEEYVALVMEELMKDRRQHEELMRKWREEQPFLTAKGLKGKS